MDDTTNTPAPVPPQVQTPITPFGDNDLAADTPEPSPVVNPPATPVVAAGTPPAATPTPAEDPAAAETQQKITSLASSLGIPADSLLAFGSYEMAEQAARFYVENAAIAGFGRQQQPPQYDPRFSQPQQQQQFVPQYQQIPPAEPQGIDLKAFGLTEDDPAAKAIRAIEAQQRQQQQQFQSRFQQFEQQQYAAARKEQEQIAASTIDGFTDPRYGTGQNVTAAQQVGRERLMGLAMGVLNASRMAGMPDPPLNVLLSRARLIDIQAANPPAPTPPAQKVPVLPSRNPSQVHTPPVAATSGKWSEDPNIRSALGV